MKFLFQLLVVILICMVLQYFLPWWSAAVAGFASAFLFKKKAFYSFVLGFAGVSMVWAGYAFWLDIQNASILSTKIAVLFRVQQPMILLLVTAIIGGITGGLGAWTGSELRCKINN
jgi:hypothetical protein